jgi:hypothetical protein
LAIYSANVSKGLPLANPLPATPRKRTITNNRFLNTATGRLILKYISKTLLGHRPSLFGHRPFLFIYSFKLPQQPQAASIKIHPKNPQPQAASIEIHP